MLNDQQLNDFDKNGYLVIENVLGNGILSALKSEYSTLIDQVALQRGHVGHGWSGLNFEQKLTRLLAQDPASYEFIDISLPLKEGLDESSAMHTGPAVFSLLTHPGILDIAESIVGTEIVSNPVQHVRIKPPESTLNAEAQGNSNMARTHWHQDAAVIVEEANDAPILTTWVAITDATPEMGCMHAVSGSHRWPSLSMHCPGKAGVGEIFIPQEFIEPHEVVHLAVKAGGVVLLNKKTWHGAGPNRSDRLRWSFDLRFQPPGFNTGRQCFPEFLARSAKQPEKVLQCASEWKLSWERARTEIADGRRNAIFNERWNHFRDDPLCA